MPGLNTFPRTARLTSKAEYIHVFAKGEKYVGDAFICYITRTEEQGSQLGMAVSRKVGGAVVRNRIKRYIREFYRHHRSGLRNDAQVVVIARPASADLSHRACDEALTRLFQRGGLLDE